MVPIGILTRNRAVCLDATLRSLSATRLPDDATVIVYDDASDDAAARRYLDTDDVFEVPHRWPGCSAWREAGLGFLKDDPVLRGVAGQVEVVRLGDRPLGVGNASCRAICDLFTRRPDAPGVILLQDDIVLTADWYERLLGQLGRAFTPGLAQGLVAGMHRDHCGWRRGAKPPRAARAVQFCSAQCYLVTREFFARAQSWFARADHEPKNFDKYLCQEACRRECEVQLLAPYVCQHFGVESLVRPHLEFFRERTGRIGLAARGPFALADRVRSFLPIPAGV
jgi:hypothetical protein